ncbi:MAG: XkdX family protein [Firmicutes bacterium]|nr:XkdX family protein [Bacillota bacterium]
MNQAFFGSVKRLYDAGKLSLNGVYGAVERGWITAAQYEEITGEACPA